MQKKLSKKVDNQIFIIQNNINNKEQDYLKNDFDSEWSKGIPANDARKILLQKVEDLWANQK